MDFEMQEILWSLTLINNRAHNWNFYSFRRQSIVRVQQTTRASIVFAYVRALAPEL